MTPTVLDPIAIDSRNDSETIAPVSQLRGTILLVEDSNTQRQLIANVLKNAGLSVIFAPDGVRAIEIIRSKIHIDLMILDYELPDMSGDNVIDALSDTPYRPPFVVSTARGSERVAVEMMKRGAVDYLIKDERLLTILPGIIERLLKQIQVNRIISEVEDALRRSQQEMRQIIDTNVDAFISIDTTGAVREWNKAAEAMFGIARDCVLGTDVIELCVPEERREFVRGHLLKFRESPEKFATRIRHEAAACSTNGQCFPVEVSINTIDTGNGWIINAFIQNISRRRELESQLVQSEKMASLGQLAAGVAHEINNPIAYVKSNVASLHEYVETFKTLLEEYEKVSASVICGSLDEARTLVNDIDRLRQKERIGEVLQDLDELFVDSEEGLTRVTEIVQNLKSFARLDEADVKEADLNECLETTLKVVANELKYKCRVTKDLAPLPRLRCHPGQLNQVFMNLLVNAAQAIPEFGDVFVRTWSDEVNIYVSVKDTGTGIAREHLNQLFTPFFTTKPVGSGTGLGLSISYGIVQKHQGEILVASEIGKGTTFTISLPREGVSAPSGKS